MKLFSIVLMLGALAGAQELASPPVEEVLRQIPADPHALDFVQQALPSSIPGVAGSPFGVPNEPIFKVGGGVTPPHIVESHDPIYSKEARKRRIEGIVGLWVVIGVDGLPHKIRVEKSVGYGLDEAAIEAVRKWRFRPGMKDGKPVAVQIHVEINFKFLRR